MNDLVYVEKAQKLKIQIPANFEESYTKLCKHVFHSVPAQLELRINQRRGHFEHLKQLRKFP